MNKYLKINNKLIDITTPIVMGILNVTPDSFFEGSRETTSMSILKRVEQIYVDGGIMVDIGGYSTRPSAAYVSVDEEISRLSAGLEIISKHFPDMIVSVDTFRAEVARHVVKNYQVPIINDVSGGTLDKEMFKTVAELKVAYILMHMRGTPQTMQQFIGYENVTAEVMSFLQIRLAELRSLGVHDVIVDPGFGFSKTMEQNYTLLKELDCLQELGVPMLVGVSRKSMIQKLLNIPVSDALNGTTAVNMLALLGGASILRVHDVKEAAETIKVYKQWMN